MISKTGFEETKGMNGEVRILSIFKPFPTIVCLCGSTRFHEAYREAMLRLTLEEKIVLTIGCDTKSDEELFSDKLPREFGHIKNRLDTLHLRKIDLADEVLILNVGGYIGHSTRKELKYALTAGKKVSFLERGWSYLLDEQADHKAEDSIWTIQS